MIEEDIKTCIADGCPLIWTCNESTHCETGYSKGFCRYHNGQPSNKWRFITQLVTENMHLIKFAASLNNALDFNIKPRSIAEVPHNGEDMHTYKRMVMDRIRARVGA